MRKREGKLGWPYWSKGLSVALAIGIGVLSLQLNGDHFFALPRAESWGWLLLFCLIVGAVDYLSRLRLDPLNGLISSLSGLGIIILLCRFWVVPLFPEFVPSPHLHEKLLALVILLYLAVRLRTGKAEAFRLRSGILMAGLATLILAESSAPLRHWRNEIRWTSFWGVPGPSQWLSYEAEEPVAKFERGVMKILEDPEAPSFVLVVLRTGRIYRMNRFTGERTLFGYLPMEIEDESGMFSMAFHPDFHWTGKERRVFLRFARKKADNSWGNILAQYQVASGSKALVTASEKILVEIPQGTAFHFGGSLGFSREGLLYTSFGDGKIPYGSSLQRGFSGSIIRIDVNCNGERAFQPLDPKRTKSKVSGYCIPFDNPFVGDGSKHPEVFAEGFRNPFRFSIRSENILLVSDVGKDLYEEVNWVTPGGNYGWPKREGRMLSQKPMESSETTRDIYPAFFYPHTHGRSAIIGGFIYEQKEFPELRGGYLFADMASGELFVTHRIGQRIQGARVLASVKGVVFSINSVYGEVWIGTASGKILKLRKMGDPTPMKALAAEDLFSSRCSPCHGERGVPPRLAGIATPADLSSRDWQDSISDEEIEKIIRFGGTLEGVHPDMPAWGQLLDSSTIGELRASVRGLNPDRSE